MTAIEVAYDNKICDKKRRPVARPKIEQLSGEPGCGVELAYDFAVQVFRLILKRWEILRLDDIKGIAKILHARLNVQIPPEELIKLKKRRK